MENVIAEVATNHARFTDAARADLYLASLKAKLARNRVTHSLFDTARFTRNLESAYRAMRNQLNRGEKPTSFVVEPVD